MLDNLLTLLVMVFFIGVKHGIDADHLATIDGIARFNYSTNPRLSRRSGLLFSLGHGVVVMLVAITVGIAATKWTVPDWLDGLGAWVSILFLFALGAINFHAVFWTPADQVAKPVGLKGRWFGRLTQTSHPLLIACVGALFALSFDTLSQAALFSLTASVVWGWEFSVVVGLVFVVGMILTDGVNGLWVTHLLSRADRTAIIASRVMGLTVAMLSLLIGAFGVAKYYSPAMRSHFEGRELLFGCIILGIVAISFMLALRLSCAPQRRSNTSPL